MAIVLKIKKLYPHAQTPVYAHVGDAAIDLFVCGEAYFGKNNFVQPVMVGSGISIEIPQGHVGLIFPRSSTFKNYGVVFTNSVGVIDSGFRGEIKFPLIRSSILSDDTGPLIIPEGARIAQLIIVPIPEIQVVEVDNLSETDRGVGGFGSTGK